jgi:hypothetical protein
MNISEFKDLGRVAYITGNVKEALDAWQALERVVEIANSVQQLKAEICSLISEIESNWTQGIHLNEPILISRLRKLSAV